MRNYRFFKDSLPVSMVSAASEEKTGEKVITALLVTFFIKPTCFHFDPLPIF